MQFLWSWNILPGSQYFVSKVGRMYIYFKSFMYSLPYDPCRLSSSFKETKLSRLREKLLTNKHFQPHKNLRAPKKQERVTTPCWAAGSRTRSTRTRCSSRWEGSSRSCTALYWAHWHYNSHWPVGPSSHRCNLKNKTSRTNWQDVLICTFCRNAVVRFILLKSRLIYH